MMKELYEQGYVLVEDYGYDEAEYSIADGDDWDSLNHYDDCKVKISHEKKEIRVFIECED